MRCPDCGCSKLRLGIVFAGEVACTFHDGAVVEILDTASLDSYWSDDSTCHCIECGWSGRVRDLQRPKPGGRMSKPCIGESRLEEIERSVINGGCPMPIRQEVRQLIGMIRQLQKQVQILETVRRAGAKGRRLHGGDTTVL
jgi:hypothetical protein